MKTLITGGAGFIGSHLAESLLERGRSVIILDDFSTGSWNNLPDHGALEVVEGSVTDPFILRNLIPECDRVFHLAAVVGVKKAFKEPLKTLETNMIGTENVLFYCAENNVRTMVFSSSEVYGYGNFDESPLSEFYASQIGSPVKSLRWAYGASKLADEFLALSYHKERNLPAVVVRPFNVVGPRQTGDYGMVLPTFIKQALTGQPITVYGDGKQSRSFAHVSEAVRAFRELMENEDAIGDVVNVAGCDEIEIGKLAQVVKAITGSGSPIVNMPYDKAYGEGFDDSRRRFASTEKLKRLLGWTPSMPLETIVLDTVDWMRGNATRL